ncbi:UDP-N-acetylmuramoyl-tripeptide--D-alanyl-D-alanine ligase [Tropicibacter sp. Alg240-R139]|uniref:UDP-N-acetylmuramoyl-tripeptide--D-alanyl-D- alanine ligase n=1 Tax=Tropicibacter sp. Alg240-R139 TaxID=2305991 RepID=UPI0013DF346E|nr:UDP-N-acetylmuramoyl-tripeptide--D-alanyl-D-alanine ligase [Tropicibacter sp. Alg240-R139]
MTLWTATEAAAATNGRAIGDWSVNGVSIDTRTIELGDLFVALQAARDGHEFVGQALEKGAGAALVSHIPTGLPGNAPLLLVDDVQAALEDLGRAARARARARVVAVTGSVGKTSTKEMLSAMLGDQGMTHASVASYNNHWGVPLTLARMPRDTEYAVIEIGMNHPGEIAPLAKQARPHVAMVTTVAAAHLEAFDSVTAIAREKAAIFEGLEPDGVAVVNADIDDAQILHDAAAEVNAKILSFGTNAQDYHLLSVELDGDLTTSCALINEQEINFEIQSAGAHFAMNGLGALAVTQAMGADLQEAVKSLASWAPFKGRGVRETLAIPNGTLELLDDSYNANPTSMAAALAVLATVKGPRRLAFIGDMKELGPQAEELHIGLADLNAINSIQQIHCVGPLMKALYAALPEEKRGKWTETSAQMAEMLPDLIQTGDIVLAKGSLSMGLARVVDGLREMGQGAGSQENTDE